nr:proline-rich receptor-like protein kinase PERK4 [Aegilops tauschii subsp. strangulata]
MPPAGAHNPTTEALSPTSPSHAARRKPTSATPPWSRQALPANRARTTSRDNEGGEARSGQARSGSGLSPRLRRSRSPASRSRSWRCRQRAQRRGEGRNSPAATFLGARADFAGGPSSGGEARERGSGGGDPRFLGSGEEEMRERWSGGLAAAALRR